MHYLLIDEVGDEGQRGLAHWFIVTFERAFELGDDAMCQEFPDFREFCIDDRHEGRIDRGEGGRCGLRFH